MMIGAGFGGRDDTYNGMVLLYHDIVLYPSTYMKNDFCAGKKRPGHRKFTYHLRSANSNVDLTGLR